MQWTDSGIILSCKSHGEASSIVTALTAQHGIHAGLIHTERLKKQHGVFIVGNLVDLHWNARLPEHLGTFRGELRSSVLSFLIDSPAQLAALSSFCTLCMICLPERDPFPELYQDMLFWLEHLRQGAPYWQEEYIRLELKLLEYAGFGLDLSTCAVTQTTEHLCYVSPRTGRAVSQAAGKEYHTRLLPLPDFLRHADLHASTDQIKEGLMLTGYFLEKHLMAPKHQSLPTLREKLLG